MPHHPCTTRKFHETSFTWNQTRNSTFPTLQALRTSSGTAKTKPTFRISSLLIL